MRKLLLFFFVCLFVTSPSFSSVAVTPPRLNANEVFIPIGKSGKTISLMDLSKIKQSDLEFLTGRKMNFFDKITFKIAQHKLQKNINADGTVDKKKLEKFFSKRSGDTGFHLGGFALGFFLGLIGVLIAYIINDDYKRSRVKWAWIGFGIVVILFLLF